MVKNATVLKAQTEDGYELDALLFQPKVKTDSVVLHFHGKEGDFLQNHFIQSMATNYPDNNIAFMTASHRGKSYMADIFRKSASGFEYTQMGSAFDIFEDCVYDIDIWVRTLQKQGFSRIYLQQHSTPQKIVWYQYQKKPTVIKGLVLISPSDIAFSFDEYVPNFKSNLFLAKKLIAEGKGKQLMPVNLWSNCPVSAGTFYNWGNPESNFQLFNYSHPENGFKYFENLTLPILAIFPESDFSVGKSTSECLQLLKQHTKSIRFSGHIIAGANHSYMGFEEKLSNLVINWVKQN